MSLNLAVAVIAEHSPPVTFIPESARGTAGFASGARFGDQRSDSGAQLGRCVVRYIDGHVELGKLRLRVPDCPADFLNEAKELSHLRMPTWGARGERPHQSARSGVADAAPPDPGLALARHGYSASYRAKIADRSSSGSSPAKGDDWRRRRPRFESSTSLATISSSVQVVSR